MTATSARASASADTRGTRNSPCLLATKFYLDKRNGKIMGVCSGIADYTGIDVTLIRIGFAASSSDRAFRCSPISSSA